MRGRSACAWCNQVRCKRMTLRDEVWLFWGKTLKMCSVILEPRVIREVSAWSQRWLYNCDNKLGQARWQTVHEKNVCAVGVLFTPPVHCQDIKFQASEKKDIHLEHLKKKKSLFNPRWRFPRIPVPRWPQVAAWLPSWWRRWRRMRCGRRTVSPSCLSFKSIIVFIKALKLLIKPLSDLSLWRDRFLSTSSDRRFFMVQSFACLLRLFKVAALIQWSLHTFCIQWSIHDLSFRLLSCLVAT